MIVKADNPQPRYRQLAEQLIAEIRASKLQVGQTLPGEHELVARFGVSRHTVREALRLVTELGLIERRQGVGTVVRSKQSSAAYVQTIRSPSELLQYPADSRLKVISSGLVTTDRKLAQLLHCATGTAWFRFGALRQFKATQAPICWTDVYLVPEYRAIVKMIGKQKRVYELIEARFGERVEQVAVDLRAGLVPAEYAAMLQCEPGAPALKIVRRYVGANSRIFEVSVSWHPAERYTYSLELKRGWQSGS
ncbi:MAG: GntR family transcriptional regulator [Steroidobacteraceae bacterium]